MAQELNGLTELDDDQVERETIATSISQNNNIPLPFLPLYSQYSFGQRLKNTIPFSKLFFSTTTQQQSKASVRQEQQSLEIIHDQEKCMFLIQLDATGRTAALCYLPTRVKGVIETYHTEIPPQFRHQGIGDKLVEECLNWAKESGTLVIPTCNFVKRHLEYVGFQKYDPVILRPSEKNKSI